jgi:hypothetical protein
VLRRHQKAIFADGAIRPTGPMIVTYRGAVERGEVAGPANSTAKFRKSSAPQLTYFRYSTIFCDFRKLLQTENDAPD